MIYFTIISRQWFFSSIDPKYKYIISYTEHNKMVSVSESGS